MTPVGGPAYTARRPSPSQSTDDLLLKELTQLAMVVVAVLVVFGFGLGVLLGLILSG